MFHVSPNEGNYNFQNMILKNCWTNGQYLKYVSWGGGGTVKVVAMWNNI
jgi:hypothetical protein